MPIAEKNGFQMSKILEYIESRYQYPEFSSHSEPEDELCCEVCYDDVPYSQTYALSCGHRICRGCYTEHAQAAVDAGVSCVTLGCPQSSKPHNRRFSTYHFTADANTPM